jgi:hypothetical protein
MLVTAYLWPLYRERLQCDFPTIEFRFNFPLQFDQRIPMEKVVDFESDASHSIAKRQWEGSKSSRNLLVTLPCISHTCHTCWRFSITPHHMECNLCLQCNVHLHQSCTIIIGRFQSRVSVGNLQKVYSGSLSGYCHPVSLKLVTHSNKISVVLTWLLRRLRKLKETLIGFR